MAVLGWVWNAPAWHWRSKIFQRFLGRETEVAQLERAPTLILVGEIHVGKGDEVAKQERRNARSFGAAGKAPPCVPELLLPGCSLLGWR